VAETGIGRDTPAPLTGEIDEGEFDASSLSLVSGEDGAKSAGAAPGEMDSRPDDPVARLRAMIGERQDETVEILRTWLEGEEERS